MSNDFFLDLIMVFYSNRCKYRLVIWY